MGFADVDAVTVAMARLVPQPLGVQGAAYAILAAVATNTLSKSRSAQWSAAAGSPSLLPSCPPRPRRAALVALWVALLVTDPA